MGCKALINRQTVWLPIANSGLNLGEDQFTYPDQMGHFCSGMVCNSLLSYIAVIAHRVILVTVLLESIDLFLL